MKYSVRFPTLSLEDKFYKTICRLNRKLQDEIMEQVCSLVDNPYPYGRKIVKRLSPPVNLLHWTAEFRLRIGDYRVLYDVDEKNKIVWIFVLRKRNEITYK